MEFIAIFGSRYQLERIAYVIFIHQAMAIIHKNLTICVLHNETANSSDCLMSNVWLMGDELRGEEI